MDPCRSLKGQWGVLPAPLELLLALMGSPAKHHVQRSLCSLTFGIFFVICACIGVLWQLLVPFARFLGDCFGVGPARVSRLLWVRSCFPGEVAEPSQATLSARTTAAAAKPPQKNQGRAKRGRRF